MNCNPSGTVRQVPVPSCPDRNSFLISSVKNVIKIAVKTATGCPGPGAGGHSGRKKEQGYLSSPLSTTLTLSPRTVIGMGRTLS